MGEIRKNPQMNIKIEEYLASKNLNLIATTDKEVAYKKGRYLHIATER